MLPQMLHESGHMFLLRCQECGCILLDVFRELQQIALICRAGERTQTLLNSQVREVVAQQSDVARLFHTLDYRERGDSAAD